MSDMQRTALGAAVGDDMDVKFEATGTTHRMKQARRTWDCAPARCGFLTAYRATHERARRCNAAPLGGSQRALGCHQVACDGDTAAHHAPGALGW